MPRKELIDELLSYLSEGDAQELAAAAKPVHSHQERELRPHDQGLVSDSVEMAEYLNELSPDHDGKVLDYSPQDYAEDLKRFRPKGSADSIDYVPSREESLKFLEGSGTDTRDFDNPQPEDLSGIGPKHAIKDREFAIKNMQHLPPLPTYGVNRKPDYTNGNREPQSLPGQKWPQNLQDVEGLRVGDLKIAGPNHDLIETAEEDKAINDIDPTHDGETPLAEELPPEEEEKFFKYLESMLGE